MSFQDLGSIGELVAALATIATLIYLAIQIHQNTRAMRATSARETLFKLSDWHQANVSNPDMMRCFKKSLQNPMPEFTVEEWSEMNSYLKTVFHLFEAAYVHGRFGVGTGDTNEPHLRAAKTLVATQPVWKKFWEEEAATGHWTEGFIEHIEQMSPGILPFLDSDGSDNDT
jgi:hypothetical protein